MRNLQEATERICELKGNLVAMDALITALLQVMPVSARAELPAAFERYAEMARTALLHAPISEHSIAAFEHDVQRTQQLLAPAPKAKP